MMCAATTAASVTGPNTCLQALISPEMWTGPEWWDANQNVCLWRSERMRSRH